MSWLFDTLLHSPNLEQSLLFRLPEFLTEGVQDRAFYHPSTSEILNSLAKTDFFIHPSTGEILNTRDVNNLIFARARHVIHNTAAENQLLEKFKPELKAGILPANGGIGWARFLSNI